jgi:3-deoxy-manno-octulosonate cytidylyltransferase (CMP-KDO synthetase)
MTRIIILIPARYQSSRFPGKPLSKILGKSMIQRVFENCQASGFESYVVTDDDRIENHVKEFKGKVLRIDDDVPSGTERIALAVERNIEGKIDLVINVQGDEPLLMPEEIQRLAKTHLEKDFEIMTLVKKRVSSSESFSNANVVKAIYVEKTNQCLYFSRASLPFQRDEVGTVAWHQHIGVYSYKPSSLIEFAKGQVSHFEKIEKLEQLRALEMGMRIGAIESDFEPLGVDTPDDIHKVEEVLSE